MADLTITRGARLAALGLLILTLLVGAGNLWASYDQARSQAQAVLAVEHRERAAQQQAGAVLGAKLCTTFAALGALKPPPGDPKTNPSRAYLQAQHDTLVQLGTDLGCK